jgi:hypothetical protein
MLVVPNLPEASAEFVVMTTEANTKDSASVSAECFGQQKLRSIGTSLLHNYLYLYHVQRATVGSARAQF